MISDNAIKISKLLKGKTYFTSKDYKEILALTKPGDLVYMDPPLGHLDKGFVRRDEGLVAIHVKLQEFADQVPGACVKGIGQKPLPEFF